MWKDLLRLRVISIDITYKIHKLNKCNILPISENYIKISAQNLLFTLLFANLEVLNLFKSSLTIKTKTKLLKIISSS